MANAWGVLCVLGADVSVVVVRVGDLWELGVEERSVVVGVGVESVVVDGNGLFCWGCLGVTRCGDNICVEFDP